MKLSSFVMKFWRRWAQFAVATKPDRGNYRVGQKSIRTLLWRLTSSAYIFKMPEPISMIFGTLQYRFIRNTAIDSVFLKSSYKVVPPGKG